MRGEAEKDEGGRMKDERGKRKAEGEAIRWRDEG
jgi:hypothetical protein